MRQLRPLGFQRVVLEECSPPEQIQLFQESEIVVAPHGAGLANLLFSTDATVLELHPSHNVAPHYYLLCKRLGHDYHYLLHDAPDVDSSFSTAPDEVARRLFSVHSQELS
jgi:capsular polysaccharide biosynthesis protein